MRDFVFSRRSLVEMKGVHPDLILVAVRALHLSEIDFVVTDGARTIQEQEHNVIIGVSWTMNSRHIPEGQKSGMSCAIDVAAWVDGRISWDWQYYEKIAAAFKAAARELVVPLEWGGDWKKRDGTHFQLSKAYYP